MTKWVTTAFSALGITLLASTASASGGINLNLGFYTVESRPIGSVPESVAVDDDDNVYYSDNATIRVHPRRGADHVFSTLPIPVFALGLKVGPDGCIYNTSVSLDPAVPGAFVWRSCEDGGEAEVFAELDHTGGPNDIAFDDQDNAFVTDPFLGRVWKIEPDGTPSIWVQGAIFNGNAASPYLGFNKQGANGIAFDKKKDNLYIGVLDYGRVVKVPVKKNGAAGTPKVFVESPALQGIDGIAFDKASNLIAAINGQNKLVAITSRARIVTLSTNSRLDSPSSVAFGTRGPISERTLYVASSAFLRTFGIQQGTPQPAILATLTLFPGLDVP